MLSIIIPSYKDPLLQKTVDSLLANAEGDIEIIAVLDGYWPEPSLGGDKRLRILHLGKNQGMRGAINAGVAISKGEYIMKTDGHCQFGKGFDKILLEKIEDNWVVVPRRYYLDTEKWEVMNVRPVDYQKFIYHQPTNRITAQEWINREKERENILIDENIIFQGSCWLMSRKHWDNVIKRLEDENYGPIAHESVEIAMKTFTSGGKVMVNKKTWYAHQHRKFGSSSGLESRRKGYDYTFEHWKDEIIKISRYFRLPGLPGL
jgi:glycosyltransferase involved in cell wall biosynthesis